MLLNKTAMETFEKILVLNNEFEAEVLEEILNDRSIPHGIIPIADSVMDGIVQLESGWGYVEAPSEYADEILRIYNEMINAPTEEITNEDTPD
jgi:hypothetical protein